MELEESGESNQYLTFKLDGEIFALPIGKVREVLDFTEVTRVPQTPGYMRGVINLRGSVVPVMDLRLKFGLGETEKTVNTCIVITEVEMEGDSIILGALADSVQEVLELGPEQIEPAPRMGTSLRAEFVNGMGKQNEEFIILLDIDRVFTTGELAAVQDAEADAPAKTDAAVGE